MNSMATTSSGRGQRGSVYDAGTEFATASGPSAGTRLPYESRRARLSIGEAPAAAEVKSAWTAITVSRRSTSNAQEGVAEGYFADVLHEGVVDKVAVDEEEDGQVDLFSGEEALLLEAEAFDFGEIRRDLHAAENSLASASRQGGFLAGWLGRTFIGVTL